MPITSSAKKALRQSIRQRGQNLVRAEAYKLAVKNFKKLVAEKKTEDAKATLANVYQALDKATKTGVIKMNKASRLKSRLSLKLAGVK
ncbi:MAG: 30S ribosomal protein S20 [Candidatus Liptonbacteria bacterium]|nr:30S ribosomal protein S20 [Candidatus Liptonbacteria bacterium]